MEDQSNLLVYQILSVLSLIITIAGAAVTIAINLRKAKPEAKKIESEGESAIAEAADSIANGAKISTEMLVARLVEMETREKAREKKERERDVREAEMVAEMQEIRSSLSDWQDWARRLVHQLKSHGHEPVPFKIDPASKLAKLGD